MPRRILCYLRPVNYDRIYCPLKHFGVVYIGSCYDRGYRAAVCLNEYAAFYAFFGPVRGVWADAVPPKRALLIAVSAACHWKSMPPSSA